MIYRADLTDSAGDFVGVLEAYLLPGIDDRNLHSRINYAIGYTQLRILRKDIISVGS